MIGGSRSVKPGGPKARVIYNEKDLRVREKAKKGDPNIKKPGPNAEDLKKAAGRLDELRGKPGAERAGVLPKDPRVPHDTSLEIDGASYPIRMVQKNWLDISAAAIKEGWVRAGEEGGSIIFTKPDDRQIVQNYLKRSLAGAGDVPIGMGPYVKGDE